MPSCVIPTCRKSTGLNRKQDGITFHTFPANEKRNKEWTDIIRSARLDECWKPKKHSVVCSIHFEEQYFYYTPRGLRRLRRKAIPNKEIAVVSVNKCEPFSNTKQKTSRPSTPENADDPLEIHSQNITPEQKEIDRLRDYILKQKNVIIKQSKKISALQRNCTNYRRKIAKLKDTISKSKPRMVNKTQQVNFMYNLPAQVPK